MCNVYCLYGKGYNFSSLVNAHFWRFCAYFFFVFILGMFMDKYIINNNFAIVPTTIQFFGRIMRMHTSIIVASCSLDNIFSYIFFIRSEQNCLSLWTHTEMLSLACCVNKKYIFSLFKCVGFNFDLDDALHEF